MALRSKCDRAIAAFLVASGAGSNETVLPANASTDKQLPLIIVQTTLCRREEIHSFVFRCQHRILVKSQATLQPGETDPEAPRVAADALFDLMYQALSQSSDQQADLDYTAQAITLAGRALATSDGTPEGNQRAADNQDMKALTFQSWEEVSLEGGKSDSDSNSWVEIATFESTCCETDTDPGP